MSEHPCSIVALRQYTLHLGMRDTLDTLPTAMTARFCAPPQLLRLSPAARSRLRT